MVVHSEFRDGNVPAGHQQLRVLKESAQGVIGAPAFGGGGCSGALGHGGLPEGVPALLRRRPDQRFGVIEFAVGVDVTREFKAEVAQVGEEEWRELYREVDGRRAETGQQWAEVNFVPDWIDHPRTARSTAISPLENRLGTRLFRGWRARRNSGPTLWRCLEEAGTRSLE